MGFSKQNMKRAGAILIIGIVLLACNFPLYQYPQRSIANQETLIATLFPEAQFSTPQPGEPVIPPFSGLRTPVPGIPPETQQEPPANVFSYLAQPGDTLPSLAARFGVDSSQVTSDRTIPPTGLIDPGQVLVIPRTLPDTGYNLALLPDSEIVYSPAAAAFDIHGFILSAGGQLAAYSEEVDGVQLSSAEIVRRVALEMSINPRLLLAFLEYRSGWVTGQPAGSTAFPIGFMVPQYQGLYKELVLTGRQLTLGYYGWREGKLTELKFVDGAAVRLHPELNAGSVALMHLFASLYNVNSWSEELYNPERFLAFYTRLFGDPWQRAQAAGPILPVGLQQPALELPFAPGEAWSYTGGPHIAWGIGTPLGAVDFAPVKPVKGCVVSDAWVTASAGGRVVRSENGIVVIDLDGDGYEQTGWSLMYLHIATKDRIPLGSIVTVNQPIGHPSCEGGVSTGTHVHLSRKYNGEWLAAGSPVPFVLSGYEVIPGDKAYRGLLINGDKIVSAQPDGSRPALIIR